MHSWMQVAELERQKADTIKASFDAAMEKGWLLSNDNAELRAGLIECHRKLEKHKTWATVGKLWTAGIGVALVGITTSAILNAVK